MGEELHLDVIIN